MAIEVLYGESGWTRFIPVTCPVAEITALGTAIDLLTVVKATPKFAAPTSATTEAAWKTTAAANGNEISVPDLSVNYDVDTGVAVAGTGADAYESLECSVTASGTEYDVLLDEYTTGRPVFAICESGKIPTYGKPYEYLYIFGNITAFKVNQAAGANTIDFTITGSTFKTGGKYTLSGNTAYDDFDTAYTGSGNTITPTNDGTARTITALASDTNYTDILGFGKFTRLANA
jgi:hypothetical protein